MKPFNKDRIFGTIQTQNNKEIQQLPDTNEQLQIDIRQKDSIIRRHETTITEQRREITLYTVTTLPG